MLQMKRSGGYWRVEVEVGGACLQRSRRGVLVSLSGAVAGGAEGIWTHFINRTQSVNFKENHPRVNYLYMERSQSPTTSSLSFNYNESTRPWCSMASVADKQTPGSPSEP